MRLWKWLFFTSLTLLIGIFPFTLVIWAFANAAAALTASIMGYHGTEGIHYEGATYSEFMSNFVDSPLFHVGVVLLAICILSLIMMIRCKKKK